MTTPEQLAKWREGANKSFDSDRFKVDGLSTYGGFVEGYLRAKQETEQAMKLAKFGAMAARKWANEAHDKIIYPDLDDDLIESIVHDVFDEEDISPQMKITMKELLND